MDPDDIIIRPATAQDEHYAEEISTETYNSSIKRGIGISRRPASVIREKMRDGKAVIATLGDGTWVGFMYYELWANGEFISQSGLIVSPPFRQMKVASGLKQLLFSICRQRYPQSKLFSISSATAIMKMNTALGFQPVGYDQLMVGDTFWHGCASCVNYDILKSKCLHHCLCTAMLYDPAVKAVSAA